MKHQTPPLTRVSQAAAKAAQASHKRDYEIREAAKTHTVRAVAHAAGLSPARVHQIIHGR